MTQKCISSQQHFFNLKVFLSLFKWDSWYTAGKVIDSFVKREFYTIRARKANHIFYLAGIHQQLSQFTLYLDKTHTAVRLVTAGNH